MNVLPKGWVETTLGEVCDVLDSRRVPVNAKERAGRPGTVPYFGATGQVGWIDRPLFNEDLLLLGEDGAPFLDTSKPKAYLIRGPAWVNNHAHVLRARTVTSNRFLLHALNWTDYRRFVNGTTRLKLTQAAMNVIPVPLPPLAEQERIVAAIEQQLSRLDTAEQLLRSALSKLDPLVVSFIDVATDGFPTKPLGELVREPLRNGHSAKRSTTGSIPVFTLTAVTARKFSQANTKLTDADPQRVGDLWAEPGDIFVERSNTPELVGTAALYSGPARRAIFPDLLIRVRCGPQLLPEYAELGLRSTRIRRYFQRVAKGIAGSMPKIDQAAVLAAELPLPPVADQARLVQEVAQNLSIAESLATAVDHALRRSGQLRRAVLERAFTGQLTPQDPSDEPAALLMERVVANRRIESPGRRQSTRKTLSR